MKGNLIDINQDVFSSFESYVTYGIEDVYLLENIDYDDPIRYCFFKDLYIDRPFYEEKIQTWIKENDGALGVITGVQGSGKSTIIKKVEQEIDRDKYPFISINFRSFFQQFLSKSDATKWADRISSYIQEAIVERYFNTDRIFSFLPYFLYENHFMHNAFHDERDMIHRKYMSINVASSDDGTGECRWFKENMFEDPMSNILDKICEKLSLEHYLIAAKKISQGQIKKFVIVFDNVDRVPKNLQCHLYSIADDIRSIHMSTVQVIIATRKETSHPPDLVCNMDPAPIVEFGIISSIESDKNKLMSDDFFKILSKRIHLYLHQAMKGFQAGVLVDISKSLKDQYAEAVLINLANQSIREALRYHCDFLGYLLSEYSSHLLLPILKTEKCESFLSSCLYSWITQYSTVLHNQCVNVVALVSDCEKSEYKNITGCDLTYLILVVIYNFKKRHYRNPRLIELVEKFTVLLYDSVKIKEALFDLWRIRNEDFGHIVTLYQYPMPEQPIDIDDSVEVEINYRGESLIKQISVTFSFINRLLYDSENDLYYSFLAKRSVKKYHDISNITVHARQSVNFFYRLAFLHTLELHKIRTRYNCENWYDLYVKDFAIDKKLQLVRILRSNFVFLDNVLKARDVGLMKSSYDDLKEICLEIKFLEALYEQHVFSFTCDNIDNKSILDFVKLSKNVYENGVEGYSIEKVLSDPKYMIDIKNYL